MLSFFHLQCCFIFNWFYLHFYTNLFMFVLTFLFNACLFHCTAFSYIHSTFYSYFNVQHWLTTYPKKCSISSLFVCKYYYLTQKSDFCKITEHNQKQLSQTDGIWLALQLTNHRFFSSLNWEKNVHGKAATPK